MHKCNANGASSQGFVREENQGKMRQKIYKLDNQANTGTKMVEHRIQIKYSVIFHSSLVVRKQRNQPNS